MLIRMLAMAIAIGFAMIVMLLAGPGSAAEFLSLIGSYLATAMTLAIAVGALRTAYRGWRHGLSTAFTSDETLFHRIAPSIVPIATFAVTMAAFTLFKQRILPGAGFGFGPTIARADQALFGTDAWRITHMLLPSAWWSQGIDLAYHAWFAPMTLGMVLCAFAARGSVLAQRYMLAFVLVWIVEGAAMAYALPAAGPCFYGYFQADAAHFANLVAHLERENAQLRDAGLPGLAALGYQAELYRVYLGQDVSFGAGISAMPSLHNAMAVLFACASFHWGRGIGRAFTGYAVVIGVGSVHLGWHYALDGIIAAVATMALWKLSGVIVHAVHHRVDAPAPRDPATAPIAARTLR